MTGFARRFVLVEGKASRGEWWTVVLTVAAVFVVVALVGGWTGWIWPLLAAMFDQPLVVGVFNLFWWLPILPVSIRRMRDRALSPRWLAAPVIWSVVAPGVIRAADIADALVLGNMLQILGVILSIVIFVQLGLAPSRSAPESPQTSA